MALIQWYQGPSQPISTFSSLVSVLLGDGHTQKALPLAAQLSLQVLLQPDCRRGSRQNCLKRRMSRPGEHRLQRFREKRP